MNLFLTNQVVSLPKLAFGEMIVKQTKEFIGSRVAPGP